MNRHVLIVLGAQPCTREDPLHAAKTLGCRMSVLTPAPPTSGSLGTPIDHVERIRMDRPDEIVAAARRLHAEFPVSGVLAYEEDTAVVAARITAELGLPAHPVTATEAAMDKADMKRYFAAAGVPAADHIVADDENDAVGWAAQVGYPVVVKPCRGRASQGVIRADNEDELRQAYRRLRRIVRDYGLDTGGRPNSAQLVERYLDGTEISVELLFQRGEAQVIAVFEKPRPLTGPFFEESVYLTPPRLDADLRRQAEKVAIRAATALGLWHGPAHCEIRLTEEGPFVLEIAARLLGGVCARIFQDRLGTDIHTVLIRSAMGERIELPAATHDVVAAAMMLPVPGEGRVVSVRGADRARRVPGIRGVEIVACPGDVIVPFPEPPCYSVGFLLATGPTHDAVEDSLAWASSSISLQMAPVGCDWWERPVDERDAEYAVPEAVTVSTIDDVGPERAREMAVSTLAETMFGELPGDQARDRARRTVAWEEANRGAPAWIFIEGAATAVSLGAVRDTTGYLCCGSVPLENRRSGIGLVIVRVQLAEFARRGCTRVLSEVDPRLPLVPAFLRHMGFEKVATTALGCGLEAPDTRVDLAEGTSAGCGCAC